MAVFTGNGSAAAPSITFSSDTDTGIFRPAADSLEIVSSGSKSRARFSPTEAVFNNDSEDCNFRVKSVSQANIFLVKASDNRVGIGTDTPQTRLEVRATSNAVSGGTTPVAIRISDNGTDGGAATWNTASDFAQLQFFSFDGTAPGGSNVRASVGAVMENSTGGTSALSFSSFSGGTPTPRVRLTSGGNLLIGGTLPSAPNINLAATGAIDAVGRVLSAPVMGHSHGQSAPATAEITNRITAMWLSASARGAWTRSGASGGSQFTSFRVGSNNSHLVWDLLLHNCPQVICSLIYVNASDTVSRSISSEYSVDGGSTWVALGNVTVGATGGAEFGGTITFATATSGIIRYVKVRAFYTSGAVSNNFVGIRNVTFTPTCTSAQFTNSLNTL
jgi:hypothetical protein